MATGLVILVIGAVMSIIGIVQLSLDPLAFIAARLGSPPTSVVVCSLGLPIAGLGLITFIIGLAVRKKQID